MAVLKLTQLQNYKISTKLVSTLLVVDNFPCMTEGLLKVLKTHFWSQAMNILVNRKGNFLFQQNNVQNEFPENQTIWGKKLIKGTNERNIVLTTCKPRSKHRTVPTAMYFILSCGIPHSCLWLLIYCCLNCFTLSIQSRV